MLLVTTPEALHGVAGAASELDGWGPVSSATARQICCDADITTVIVGPDGTPLDVRRTRREPTRRQRLAVTARDRRCVGCGAPARRCQAHHIRWWSDGGPTDIANLVHRQHLPVQRSSITLLADGRRTRLSEHPPLLGRQHRRVQLGTLLPISRKGEHDGEQDH